MSFGSPRCTSGGTIATSLLRCTQDALNLSFHMFPYIEILNVSKSIFEINNQIYLSIPNFSQIDQGVWELRAPKFWGQSVGLITSYDVMFT